MEFFPIFSERANHDLVSRLRLKEGSLINKSLASLGNVINALGSIHSYHYFFLRFFPLFILYQFFVFQPRNLL